MDKLAKLAPLIKDLAPLLREFMVVLVLGGVIVWMTKLMRRDETRVDRFLEQLTRMITIVDVQAQTMKVLEKLDLRYHKLVLLLTRMASKFRIDLVDLDEADPEPEPKTEAKGGAK